LPTGPDARHEIGLRLGRGKRTGNLAVRKPRKPVARTGHAEPPLNIRVPAVERIGREWPWRTLAVGRGEILAPETEVLAAVARYADAPLQGACPDPQEWPVRRGGVGAVQIVDEGFGPPFPGVARDLHRLATAADPAQCLTPLAKQVRRQPWQQVWIGEAADRGSRQPTAGCGKKAGAETGIQKQDAQTGLR
jgi:hypothetical protein